MFNLFEDNPAAPQLSPIVAARAVHFGRQPSVGISRQAYNEQLKIFRLFASTLETLPNITVVSLADQLCDRDFCQSTVDDKPLYRDDNHLSVAGALRLQELFRKILQKPYAVPAPLLRR